MQVVVTGASGFIGGAFIRVLAVAGHAVTAVLRRPDAFPAIPGVRVVPGDLAAEDGLSQATADIEHADAIAHLAALRKDWRLPAAVVHRVNVTSGVAILQRAKRAQRFLFVSSAGVHGYAAGAPLDEEASFAPYDSYGEAKVAAEHAVRDAASAHGTPLVLVRPSIVYGPGDAYGMVANMARLMARRRFLRVGKGLNCVQPLYIDDLAQGLLAALTTPRANGQTFLLAGKEEITLKRLARLIADALGTWLPPVGVPEVGVRMIASVLARYSQLRDRASEPFVTHAKVNLMTRNYTCDTRKAEALLGFEPAVDAQEGVERAVAWLRASGLLVG